MPSPRSALVWLAAVLTAFALVAFAYPSGPAALVGDLRHAAGDRRDADGEGERLAGSRRGQGERQAVRQAVTTDVLAGRCDLHEAVRRFAEVNADDPAVRDAMAAGFGPLAEDELTARSVLSHAEMRAGDAGLGVLARLRDQFRERFGPSPDVR